MDGTCNYLEDNCNFMGLRPVMVDLPYPAIRAKGRNQAYANLLSVDYCGQVSELSALTQYVNQENRLSLEKCAMAKAILGIAMAEMVHLQKLGQLITLLGGTVDYAAKLQNGKRMMWTPEYLSLPDCIGKMISVSIEGEKAAINQYRMHIKMMDDPYVNAVLARIIKDEEYHIMILQALRNEAPR